MAVSESAAKPNPFHGHRKRMMNQMRKGLIQLDNSMFPQKIAGILFIIHVIFKCSIIIKQRAWGITMGQLHSSGYMKKYFTEPKCSAILG